MLALWDRSFFTRWGGGGAGGIWGGTQKKNGLKGGPSKKNKGEGVSHKILPLLEGSRGKKIASWGGHATF